MDIRPLADQRRKLHPAQEQEIRGRLLRRSETGETASSIAAEFGISREWATKLLKKSDPQEANGPLASDNTAG